MITELGREFGIYLYKLNIIDKSEIETVRYAIEIIYSEGFEIFFIIFYSILNNQILESFVFVITFSILRKIYEGYHEKTIFKCFILTITVFVSVINIKDIVYIEMSIIMLVLVKIIQIKCFLIDYVKKQILISFVFEVLSICFLFLGMYSLFQIIVLTELVVLVSYILERRQL